MGLTPIIYICIILPLIVIETQGLVRISLFLLMVLSDDISSLERGKVYYYRISPSSQENPLSNIITVRTLLPAPTIQSAIGINDNSFIAYWDWDNPEYSNAALYYELEVSSNQDLSDPMVYKSYNLSNRVLGLDAGGTYHFRVRAVSNEGPGDYSSILPTTLIPGPPEPMVDVEPTVGSFTARWDAAQGTSEYRIQLSYDIDFNRIVSDWDMLSVEDTFIEINGLVAGYSYYYRVWSKAVATLGDYLSAPSSIIEQPIRPLPPITKGVVDVGGDIFRAIWENTSASNNFSLDLSRNRDFSDIIVGPIETRNLSYLFDSLETEETVLL